MMKKVSKVTVLMSNYDRIFVFVGNLCETLKKMTPDPWSQSYKTFYTLGQNYKVVLMLDNML